MGQLALILLPQSKGRFCTCSKQFVGVGKVHRSLRTCIRSRSPFRLFVRSFVLPFCLLLRNKAGIFFKLVHCFAPVWKSIMYVYHEKVCGIPVDEKKSLGVSLTDGACWMIIYR